MKISPVPNKICITCGQPAYCKSLCRKHYQQWWSLLKNPTSRKQSCLRYSASAKGRSVHQKYRSTPRGRWNCLRRQCKDRGLELKLSKEEYLEVIRDLHCSYCGGTLGPGSGLDRLDNSKGYSVSNVRTCCNDCNRLRQDRLSPEELEKIVAFLKVLRNTDLIWETT